MTHYVLFVIELATRGMYITCITVHPHQAFMTQIARNLINTDDGILRGKSYLTVDRYAKFSDDFRSLFQREGVEVICLPPRSPNLNAYAERFVRSIKEECHNRIIPLWETSLRTAVREYAAHYHDERNHQGLDNRLINLSNAISRVDFRIHRRDLLGGLLSYCYRAAA